MVICGRPIAITGRPHGLLRLRGGRRGGACAPRCGKLLKEGADYIKIVASGGSTRTSDPNRASYTVAELAAMTDEARRHGKLTAAHCTSAAVHPELPRRRRRHDHPLHLHRARRHLSLPPRPGGAPGRRQGLGQSHALRDEGGHRAPARGAGARGPPRRRSSRRSSRPSRRALDVRVDAVAPDERGRRAHDGGLGLAVGLVRARRVRPRDPHARPGRAVLRGRHRGRHGGRRGLDRRGRGRRAACCRGASPTCSSCAAIPPARSPHLWNVLDVYQAGVPVDRGVA